MLQAGIHLSGQNVTITFGSIVFAVLCSVLASNRGRNPVVWAIIGFFTSCIGLIVLLALGDLRSESEAAEQDAVRRARRNRRAGFDEPPPMPPPPPPLPPPMPSAASATGAAWHYAVERTVHGPVAEAELRHLLRTHALDAQTLVWTDGMAEWQRAGNVQALRPDLG